MTDLATSPVAPVTVGGASYGSSSKLSVTWTPPTGSTPVRYDVRWTETVSGEQSAAGAMRPPVTLSELKASTDYRIEVTACSTEACTGDAGAAVQALTPPEVWQLQGTGGSVASLAPIVPDGNVKLHAVRYGDDAPASLGGRIILYYGPMQQSAKGLAVGLTSAPATAASPSSYLSFTSLAGSAGLLRPPSAALLVGDVATGQAVPTMTGMRLFFEAPGRDGRTRILALDAQDGYVGQDFNRGPSPICATQADYDVGGGCEPSVVIGVEGDAVGGNPRIRDARQHKVGYPTLASWKWNGATGTFMVFTTGTVAGCSTSPRNHGYAVWNGSAWQVQYDGAGCPKLFRSVQAMHPLHVGGVRYKMYYGDPSDQTGRVPTSNLPFLGPKMLIYADGALTGDPARVDYEDWESTDHARRLVFLWPSGAPLDATAIGYIDDFTVLTPTNSLALQVMYVAITDGVVVPFAAAAVLLNP